MDDDALRVAGGPRRVAERHRLPLVAARRGYELGRALNNEVLVFDLTESLAGSLVQRVVEVDDERHLLKLSQSSADGGRELSVGDQDLGLAVGQDVGDRAGVE